MIGELLILMAACAVGSFVGRALYCIMYEQDRD